MQPGPASDAGLTPARRDRSSTPRRRRRLTAALIVVLALCGLAAATRGLLTQVMPRRFTVAQQRQIEAWEVGRRWHTLPEAAIFPAAVSYQLPGQALGGTTSLTLTARRLGIDSPASCARGTDAAAARVLAAYGCTTILRATYADATSSMLVTIGVAVLPGSAAASEAGNQLYSAAPQDPHGAVLPAPVPGTLAASFASGQRQLAWETHAGSYVILASAGYADGRPAGHLAGDGYLLTEMSSLAEGLGDEVSGVLGQAAPVPVCPGAPGC